VPSTDKNDLSGKNPVKEEKSQKKNPGWQEAVKIGEIDLRKKGLAQSAKQRGSDPLTGLGG